MDSHSITLIIVLIILIALSAFFSATETAFSSLSRIRIKSLAQDGNRKAKQALKLSEKYDALLSTILVGNNVVNIASTTIATLLFVSVWPDMGATISTVVMTLVVLIFGEVTPKSLAKEDPENFAMAVTPVIKVLMTLLTPINFLLLKIKNGAGKLVGGKKQMGITEDELLTIVDEAEQVGGIDEHESELLRNAIEFTDLEAIDIMTPRIDVEAVDVTSTNAEIAEVFKNTGYSRLPVYEETVDSICGVINEKDFHNYVFGTSKTIESIMKPAEFIPPSVKISQLMKTLQRNKLHMAVIVDEFGGTEGIVTLEDIIEELVGEIWDEHDEIRASIKDLGGGSFLVPTDTDLDDMLDEFDIEDDDTDASTVNGWVMEKIDKIPAVGDNFDYKHLHIKVTKAENQKAEEIIVTVGEKPPEDDDE